MTMFVLDARAERSASADRNPTRPRRAGDVSCAHNEHERSDHNARERIAAHTRRAQSVRRDSLQ